MRRAKIVCTLGPATASPRRIRELVYAGMDVARLNMSHGSHEDHAESYRLVREASDASGHGVGIFADLQGPKIRLETFAEGSAHLRRGQEWVITTRDVPGDAEACGTTYKGLPGDVSVGDPILIDDGKIRLRVLEVGDTDVRCEVLVGGRVSNNKGINLPGVAVSVPALSAKDEADLRFALSLSVDFVALSFVRDAKDAEDVRRIDDVAAVYDLAREDLIATLGGAATTLDTVAQQQASLRALELSLTSFASQGDELLRQSGPGLSRSLRLLDPVTATLARYSPELPCLIEGLAKGNEL